MRTRRIVCLGIALVLPQLATATVPVPEKSLGQIESILDFCAKEKPQSASKFKDLKKLLAGDATEDEMSAARKSADYTDSYKDTSEKLSEASQEKAAKACSAYVEGK
jgi:hypothetical protein